MKSNTLSFTMMIVSLPIVFFVLSLTNILFDGLQDLSTSLNDFIIDGGEFDGPTSVHTMFSEALERYMDERQLQLQYLWEQIEPHINTIKNAMN